MRVVLLMSILIQYSVLEQRDQPLLMIVEHLLV